MYICTMYSKELLKGTLSVIILKLLAENGKMYGYQITQKVKELSADKILIKEGSLYPALHKLLADELIEVETVNIGKRIRRYYTLTEKGITAMNEKIEEIKSFMETLRNILSFKTVNQFVSNSNIVLQNTMFIIDRLFNHKIQIA